jgi:hypothetical protein
MAWSLALLAHGRAAMEQLGLIEEQQLAVAAHLTFLVGLGEVSAELGRLAIEMCGSLFFVVRLAAELGRSRSSGAGARGRAHTRRNTSGWRRANLDGRRDGLRAPIGAKCQSVSAPAPSPLLAPSPSPPLSHPVRLLPE